MTEIIFSTIMALPVFKPQVYRLHRAYLQARYLSLSLAHTKTHTHTDKHTHTQTHTHTYTDKHTHRNTKTHTDTNRHTD